MWSIYFIYWYFRLQALCIWLLIKYIFFHLVLFADSIAAAYFSFVIQVTQFFLLIFYFWFINIQQYENISNFISIIILFNFLGIQKNNYSFPGRFMYELIFHLNLVSLSVFQVQEGEVWGVRLLHRLQQGTHQLDKNIQAILIKIIHCPKTCRQQSQ